MPAEAARRDNLGLLTGWYADTQEVYYLATGETVNNHNYLYYTVTYEAGSLALRQAFVQAALYGEELWNDNLTNLILVSYGTKASFEVITGTYTQLSRIYDGLAGASDDSGYTMPYPADIEQFATYNGDEYYVNGVEVDLSLDLGVNERNTGKVFAFVDYTETTWLKNVIAHEMGHALGWYGHTTSASRSLMSSGGGNLSRDKSSLRPVYTRDTEQIDQIYGLVYGR